MEEGVKTVKISLSCVDCDDVKVQINICFSYCIDVDEKSQEMITKKYLPRKSDFYYRGES